MLDQCDKVGLVEIDFNLASSDCGQKITEKTLAEISSRVESCGNGKYFIPKFINFQYGKLSHSCPPHKTILNLVEMHGLQQDGLIYHYPKATLALGIAIPTRQDKTRQEEDKNGKGSEKTLEWSATPTMLRLGKLFKRKDSTVWSHKEIKALKLIEPVQEEDILILEKYYSAKHPPEADYRIRSLDTLLNNWHKAVDRARCYQPKKEYNL